MSEHVNGTAAPDVVEVFKFMHESLSAAQVNGRKFKGCILIVVDENNGWAAQTSGFSSESICQLLQLTRDDAVLGGKGFTVIVPKNDEAQSSTVQ